eukprot:Clim_evm75s243 gene=Clim_evmTU75s243
MVQPPQLTPEAFARFQDGVRCTFKHWTTIKLALEHEFAGPATEDIVAWFMGCTIDLFDPSVNKASMPDADSLDHFLDQFLSDEFSVQSEDDSTWQVANTILKMHGWCMTGNFSALDQHIGSMAPDRLQRGIAVDENGNMVAGNAIVNDSSDDEDNNGNDGNAMDEDGMELDANGDSLPRRARPEPIVDEDGFELVQKGRRR